MRVEKLVEIAERYQDKLEEFEKIALNELKEFRKRFPFKVFPNLIDELTPEKLYNPQEEEKNYFFYYVEHKTKNYGRITIGSANPWENAQKNIDLFKKLLRIAVSDKPLHEKLDASWSKISGFGGDKHIAKKIISLYNPEETLPFFKTSILEDILSKTLNITRELWDQRAKIKFKNPYSKLSVGEKYEILTELALEWKNSHEPFKNWSNVKFIHFLYRIIYSQYPGGANMDIVVLKDTINSQKEKWQGEWGNLKNIVFEKLKKNRQYSSPKRINKK